MKNKDEKKDVMRTIKLKKYNPKRSKIKEYKRNKIPYWVCRFLKIKCFFVVFWKQNKGQIKRLMSLSYSIIEKLADYFSIIHGIVTVCRILCTSYYLLMLGVFCVTIISIVIKKCKASRKIRRKILQKAVFEMKTLKRDIQSAYEIVKDIKESNDNE